MVTNNTGRYLGHNIRIKTNIEIAKANHPPRENVIIMATIPTTKEVKKTIFWYFFSEYIDIVSINGKNNTNRLAKELGFSKKEYTLPGISLLTFMSVKRPLGSIPMWFW